MGNSTEEGNATSSATFNLTTVSIIFCSFNILLSIAASLGNALILIALRNVSSLYPPTKLLFQCFAMTDFGVGLTSQPFYATHVLYSAINVNRDIFLFSGISWALSICLCGVSLFTTTALSVDRLLALLLRLTYRQVVKLKRVRVVVFCFCLISVLCSFMFLFWDRNIVVATLTVLGMLTIITSLLSYTTIFIKRRLHQATMHRTLQCNDHHGQPVGEGIPAWNIAQYKTTVTSIALVQSALVICYIPFVILNAILFQHCLKSCVFNSRLLKLIT